MAPLLWQNRTNRFQQILKSGGIPISVWVKMPWPPVMEMIGAHGADAAMIDMEHSTMGFETVESLIVSAQLAGITPMVRVPGVDPETVGRLLDARAEGIVFPNVKTPDEALAARKSMHYAPEGSRGWGGPDTRHAVWQGMQVSPDGKFPEPPTVYSEEYINKVHQDLITIFMIESEMGVQNVDEILDVGKPDLVIMGMGDYSVEVNFDEDRCVAAGNRVYSACRERGIGTRVSLHNLETKSKYYPGCYTSVGADSRLLSRAIEVAVRNGRRAIAEHGPPSPA